MSRQVRVTAAHQPRAGEPLRLRAGEVVTVGRRDEAWPAWAWCTTDDGRGGWVPEAYLARESPDFDRAATLHDYDATELEAREGERLEVLGEEGGWLWAAADDGRIGWIPASVAEPA